MKMPNVSNIAKYSDRNIVINVMAYRELSQAELMRSVAYFRTTKQGRKLKSNTTYTIISVIGAND